MNKVLENIKRRRSIRKYLSKQIKDNEIEIILESAIYAPTGGNEQPWHFTVVQNNDLIDRMNLESKKLMENSPIEWVSKMGKSKHLNIFFHAPTVVIVSGRENAISPLPDCCAAIQNMLLAAESIDIGSCWIGLVAFFFEHSENIKELGIPKGYNPYYAVSLGYKAAQNNNVPERNKDVVNYIK